MNNESQQLIDEIVDPSDIKPLEEDSNESEDTGITIEEGIDELERQQEINEALVNVPTEFEVNGKTIEIRSKSPKQLVQIDKSILNLLKIQYEKENMNVDDVDNFWDNIESLHEKYFQANVDVLFKIINEDFNSPDFSVDWISENIDLSLDGVGEQILDAYNAKCTPSNFFQKAIRSRKF